MTVTLDREAAQRHTVRTLMVTQVLSGVGLAAGATVGSILAEKISGRTDFAGLGGTFQTLGAALFAIPVAALAHRAGRRPSLTFAYAVAVLGALGIVAAAVAGSFALLLAGCVLLGCATAANSAARYAAADLALPAHRGRDLSLVVWVTTVGSVLGPNLTAPARPLARALGVDELAGPFVISAIVLTVGAVVMWARLRPDPLLLARALAPVDEEPARGSVRRGLSAIRASRRATAAVGVTALGHMVMVSLMVMTPLHMVHGHASLEIVGFVISGHILGMFALSPLMGIAVDRVGAGRVAIGGGLLLLLATFLAGRSAIGYSHDLALGLFVLGVGWSATLVSGSTLLVASIPIPRRAGAQGVSDLVMGMAAASGGAIAGVVVDQWGYARLAQFCALLAVAVVLLGLLIRRSEAAATAVR